MYVITAVYYNIISGQTSLETWSCALKVTAEVVLGAFTKGPAVVLPAPSGEHIVTCLGDTLLGVFQVRHVPDNTRWVRVRTLNQGPDFLGVLEPEFSAEKPTGGLIAPVQPVTAEMLDREVKAFA